MNQVPVLVVRIADGFTMSIDHGALHLSGDFDTVENGLAELTEMTGLDLFPTFAE